MDDLKTVEGSVKPTDPLIRKQREGVAAMRTSLLAYSADNPAPVVRQITTLQIYHQLTRIVRYLDLMDKLEAKMYDAIETTLDTLDTFDAATGLTLLSLQEHLQENMIKSHKLLEPYLSLDTVKDLETLDVSADEVHSILDRASRDNVRKAAQVLLAELNDEESST